VLAILLYFLVGPRPALAELLAEVLLCAVLLGGGGGGRIVRLTRSWLGGFRAKLRVSPT
jgi:hypothetical protein